MLDRPVSGSTAPLPGKCRISGSSRQPVSGSTAVSVDGLPDAAATPMDVEGPAAAQNQPGDSDDSAGREDDAKPTPDALAEALDMPGLRDRLQARPPAVLHNYDSQVVEGLSEEVACVTAVLLRLPQWLRQKLLRYYPAERLPYKTVQELDDFLLADQVDACSAERLREVCIFSRCRGLQPAPPECYFVVAC